MQGIVRRVVAALLPLIACAFPAAAQQDTFHWIDFHAEKDQPVVVWVTRALSTENWSAIREIGVLYDAALVVTTTRAGSDALPFTDHVDVWSVNLTNHAKTVLLKGVNLRWADWIQLSPGAPREIAILYDDCRDCAATTYFTSFHYDVQQHILAPRWMRGGQGAPVWSSTAPEGVTLSQAYAVLTQPDGRQYLGTWSHFDYGKQKPAEDFLFRYGIDAFSGLDSTQLVSNKDADLLKQHLCAAQPANPLLASGQDSSLCQQTVHPRPERRPVTTPPANPLGRSVPPKR